MIIRTGYISLKHAFFCITTVVILFFHAFSSEDFPSPDDSGSCVLDFQEFPYQPSGECIGHQEGIKALDSISTTLCCRGVLNALTTTLAFHAKKFSGGTSLFLQQEQWRNCSGPFRRQSTVSPYSCGFDNLYSGSAACTSFPLSSIQNQWYYKRAVESCSGFASSYSDACTSCTQAVLDARDSQLAELNVSPGDNKEKAVCGLAVVIAVVASKLDISDNRSSINDFYKCLTLLDAYDSGYVNVRYSVVKTVGAVLAAIVTLLLVILLIKYVTRGKRKHPVPVARSEEITEWCLYRFSKAEIENAINYANRKKSLGRGSAGQVYKGVLPSGQIVAIKHIHKSSSSDSFQREVQGLSRVRHPNLVCLFGCCIEGGDRYLVYEYCSAGNLAQHLLRKDRALTWDIRVKILRECALGLRYLHHYIGGCIVHRDIKLTNILLTEKLEPKLSDFGLAKMLGMEESKVFTEVRGTMGYMDPEYMSNAKLTCASDIYSFGIVALQILSGQKVIALDLDARDQLTRKAKDVSAGKRPVTDFEDPNLKGRLNKEDFRAILEIAVFCVAKSSEGRPTIDDVFDVIEKAWKNTDAEMKANHEMHSPPPLTRSLDVLPV